MKRLVQGFLAGVRHFNEEVASLTGPSRESLRETDWFCIRFFVSLQVALFYGVLVLSEAIELLPQSPKKYVLVSGAAGVIAALLLRQAWTVGKKRS